MTSTKRPDGGELKPCPFCDKPLYVKRGKINPYARCATENCFGAKMPVVSLDVPADVEAWNTRTPTNESPAPQATKKTYIKPLRAIVEIDERYADQIRDLLNVPAPQPPVEGLREALRAKINEVNILVREYDTSNPDWAFRSGVMLNVLTKMCRDLDALASPSLTAGENTKSDGGNAPFAYAWEEMVDPTGEVINGKTVTRFATHWSTPPANADVKKLYLHPSDPSPTAPAPDAREAIARNFIAIMQRHLRIERSDGGYIVGWSEAADALSQQPVAVADREAILLAALRASCAEVCSYATPHAPGSGCYGDCRSKKLSDFDSDSVSNMRAVVNTIFALLHPQPAKGER
ncbi:MAG: hypothetical protein NVV83_10560 [Afipia sp.]|nr:hypothetical protein [Afipia sp.]